MKDEEEDNIIPNDDENNESFDNTANEGFEDVIRPSTGSHFYENDENCPLAGICVSPGQLYQPRQSGNAPSELPDSP